MARVSAPDRWLAIRVNSLQIVTRTFATARVTSSLTLPSQARTSFQHIGRSLIEPVSTRPGHNAPSLRGFLSSFFVYFFLSVCSFRFGLAERGVDATSALELAGGEHARLRRVSSRLALAKTTEAGRFLVAAEPIHTGDTLVVEEAYVRCLSVERFGSHCHHCMRR